MSQIVESEHWKIIILDPITVKNLELLTARFTEG